MLPLFAERVGLLVIDEAHCISRLGPRLPARLPAPRGDARRGCPTGVAVLVHDRDGQRPRGRRRRGAAARSATPARCAPTAGRSARTSLRLEVVDLPAPGRPARLARRRTCRELPGSGIVYTLTKRDAELVAEWLNAPRHRRRGLQRRGRDRARGSRSRSGCCATSSRRSSPPARSGMGYDKPDLGFVVHYQAPGSVISYYQQVGRAGPRRRARRRRAAARRRGPPDPGLLHRAGVPAARARRPRARGAGRRRTARRPPALMAAGQPRRGPDRGDAQGARRRGRGRRATARAGARRRAADWSYDGERYARVTALRRREQAAMAAFGADGRCLMRALQEELDDPDPQDCGRCAVCAGAALRRRRSTRCSCARRRCTCARGRSCSRSRRWRPTPSGAMRKIPEDVRAEEGRALARLGDGGWDPLVQAGRRDGPLRRRARRRRGRGRARAGARRCAWVAAVPSRRSGDARARLRARGSPSALGLPFAPVLERVGDGPPQREMANSRPAGRQRARRVRGHAATLPAGPVPARRRRPLQRLDAGDGRRPAAPARRAGRSTRSR